MRQFFLLLLVLLVPTGLLAQAEISDHLVRIDEVGQGSLLIPTQYRDVYVEAVTVRTDVSISVTGMISRAKVVQQFENPIDSCIDAKYVFPLPDGAAVDAYRMRIGPRTIEGEIHEREEAEKIYEEAKAAGQTASIVERKRPNVFSISLANVGAREVIEVEIEYQSLVRWADGIFELRFPTVVAPRYEPETLPEASTSIGVSDEPMPDIRYDDTRRQNRMNLMVDLDAGVSLDSVASVSHSIDSMLLGGTRYRVELRDSDLPADRDFVLQWTPRRGAGARATRFEEIGDDGLTSTMIVMLPPDSSSSIAIPKEVVFIIDTSGSMAGPSLRQAKAALHDAVSRLRPIDRFEVIEFNSETRRMFGGLEPVDDASRERALDWIDALESNGGTEMKPALASALDIPVDNPTAVRQVVFVTDGQVGNEADLFRFVNERLGRSRIFAVGIGSAPNSYLMNLISKAGRGTYTFIGDELEIESKMGALFRKLESPVLTGIEITSDDPELEMQPSPVPDLYSGEPLVLTLRTRGSSPVFHVTSSAGALLGDGMAKSVSRELSGISRLHASRSIASLEESVILGAREDEVKPRIIELALENRLVTKYTSFVAVDRSGPSTFEVCESVPVKVNLPAGWGGQESGLLPRGGTAAPLHLMIGLILLGAAMTLVAGLHFLRSQ